MLGTTLDIIRSGLKADPTVSTRRRTELLAYLRQGSRASKAEPPKPTGPPRVLTRGTTAQTLDRSLRFVDRLAKEGVLKKIRLPGRQRAIGFLAADVERLVSTSRAENEAPEEARP